MQFAFLLFEALHVMLSDMKCTYLLCAPDRVVYSPVELQWVPKGAAEAQMLPMVSGVIPKEFTFGE